ncbi:MAG: hypothetical protein ABSD42_12250 [Candidatus Bathyarchaeia archaeon]
MGTINSYIVSAGVAIIVIIIIFPLSCSNAQAQTNIAFNPVDQFSIPAYNGSISFAVNGTYFTATFENNSWTFTNLLLTGSAPLENFEVSTQNSNLTILSYLTSNITGFQIEQLRYVVEGRGKQIVNLGLGPEESGLSPIYEWSVVVNGKTFLSEGADWSVSNDGTMTINGESGNVSLVHFNFSDFGSSASNSNLPFYQQHSVVIGIATTVAVVVVIAVGIKVKNKEKPSESG